MRWIGWIFALLLAVGWVATDLPPIVVPAECMSPDLWRRTNDGWERAEWLRPDPPATPPWLHPGLLATFQIVVSVVGFALCYHHRLDRAGHDSGPGEPLHALRRPHHVAISSRNCSKYANLASR